MMLKKFAIGALALTAMTMTMITDANAWSLGSATRQAHRGQAPLQFQIFCLQNPGECRRSRISSVSYNGHIKNVIRSINDQVNRQIKPKADKGGDVWSISSTTGDCDDYVMTKRHRLIRAGIPASALRIAVVRTSWGEGHAVLLVKTSSGEYVLDNIRKSIVSRGASGYRYLNISSADPTRWGN